jgi:hypothetical protein
VLKRLHVTITGDNFGNTEALQTIGSMLQFEQDPIRRAFLMDYIYRSKNIPIPPQVQQPQPEQGQPQGPDAKAQENIVGDKATPQPVSI